MGALARRLSDLWGGLFDAFVRDNKILPPVLALLALLLFAWVAAGLFITDPEEEGASGRAELVQSRDPAVAPEVEDRDADSYAAYRNKDPFRQLLAPADSGSDDTTADGTPTTGTPTGEPSSGDSSTTETSPNPDDTTSGGGGGGNSDGGTGGGGTGGGGTGGGQRSGNDSDGDGLTNRREARLGQDARDRDTDDDGIEDGAEDADGDGVADGQRGNNSGGAGGTGSGTGGAGGGTGGGTGGGGAGGENGQDDELFDSGGTLRPR